MPDTERARRSYPPSSRPMASRSPLAPTPTSSRAAGPIAIERDHMARVTEVYMQTEGRDVGSAAEELEKKLGRRPADPGIKWRYVGEMELMRTTFSGLGVAIGLAVMVVFMVMTIQFKSLRLAIRHALRHSGVPHRHHPRPPGCAPRILRDRADGDPDGDRHRGLQWDPAGRRGKAFTSTAELRRRTRSSRRRRPASPPS